jgi:hypothetical protein
VPELQGVPVTPVRATVVSHEEFWSDDVEHVPGMVALNGETRILCVCPCGCGGVMNLPIRAAGAAKTEPIQWEIGGAPMAPTLDPSIRDLGACRFHGHLRDGVWTFEPDSGAGRE